MSSSRSTQAEQEDDSSKPVPAFVTEMLSKIKSKLGERVEVEGKIGEGTYACVYRGMFDQTSVAVKVNKELSHHEWTRKELAVLERYELKSHPNIIQLKYTFRYNDAPVALLLDYCEMGCLAACIAQPNLQPTFDASLKISAQFASALAALHNASYIHGDVSTLNILVKRLGSDPLILISDFGSMTYQSEVEDLNEMIGSPFFAGPEWFKEPIEPSGKEGDVYAYGMVLWSLFSWEGPYKQYLRSTDRLPAAIRGGEREAVNPSWPASLINLLNACRHEDKSKRPTMDVVNNAVTFFGEDTKRHKINEGLALEKVTKVNENNEPLKRQRMI